MNMIKHVKVWCAALLSLAAVSGFAQDARDGLVAWWTSLGDLNGNGQVDANEVYDRINYSTAETPTVAESVGHRADGESPVIHGSRDYIDSLAAFHTGAKVLDFQAPFSTNAVGEFISGEPQTITLPCTGTDITGSCSFMIRFYSGERLCKNAEGKWDQVHLLDYAFTPNTYAGLAMILRPYPNDCAQDNCQREGYFGVLFRAKDKSYPERGVRGQEYLMSRVGAGIYQPGYWYDFCVTVDVNVPESGQARVRMMVRRNTFKTRDDTQTAMVATSACTNDYLTIPEFSGADANARKVVLGNRSDAAGTTTTETSTMMARQFRGDVAFVKVWNRAISLEEFEQACSDGYETSWCLGMRNGAANEFSDTVAETVYEPATMPWYKFRKSLASGGSASVRFEIPVDQVTNAYDRVLQAKVVGSGGFRSGCLDIGINGTSVGRMNVTAGEDALFLIRKKVLDFRALSLLDGKYPVTLTLTRTDAGPGILAFDYLELQGWQLGREDYSYGEFPIWGNPWTVGMSIYAFTDYYACVRDLSAMSGQMRATGSWANQTMRFFVSDAMAKNCSFEYQTRSVGGGTFQVYLNDVLQCETNLVARKAFSLPLKQGDVLAGMNKLKLSCIALTSGSTGFDYHRIVPVKAWHEGMVIIFR